MFEPLIDYVKNQRLGSAFAALLTAFVGIGAIAMTGPKPTDLDALYATSSITPSGPFAADPSGLMLGGYDPVAYFTDGRPRKGVSVWTARWGDARFHFASPENRQAFMADPTRYLPQFGGHDAEGVRMGELREADPTKFAIVQDKLYLLHDRQALSYWIEDLKLNAAVANLAWPRLMKKLES